MILNEIQVDIPTFSITGQGYHFMIAEDAKNNKEKILSEARKVDLCENEQDFFWASHSIRRLAEIRISVENSRKEIKSPIIDLGKNIDIVAKQFLAEIQFEEARLKAALGGYAKSIAASIAEKERLEKQAFEIARIAREKADSASEKVESLKQSTISVIELLQAKKDLVEAEREKGDALALKLVASQQVHAQKMPAGIKFVLDYEITNIYDFFAAFPDFVRLEIKRAEVIAFLKTCSSDIKIPGIKIISTPVVACR